MKVTESHQNVSSKSALHFPLEFTHASNLICVVNTHTQPQNPLVCSDIKLTLKLIQSFSKSLPADQGLLLKTSLRKLFSYSGQFALSTQLIKSIMSLWSQPMQYHSFFINLLPFFLAPYLPTSINLRLISNQFIVSEIYHCHFLDVITLSAGCEGQSNCS